MILYNYLRQNLRGVDPAVFWGGMTRISLFVATPLIILSIASYFTPELQGYYYTFSSLLALQVFGELGLGQVVLLFTSHEWSKLRFDDSGFVAGDPDALTRLVSLGRLVLKWFAVAAPLVSIVLGLVGFFFFSEKAGSEIKWLAPWLVLCVLTGINFCLMPVWSLLNGCHQVAQVSYYKLWDSIFFNIVLLLSIVNGMALWSPVLALTTRLIWGGIFLSRRYPNFIKTFFSPLIASEGSSISWGHEIWPLQWRSAVCWISGYFAVFIFTPVMFYFHGPVLAGQTGMTLLLVEVISSISAIWITAKAPRFGSLIAKKDYEELDKLFWRITKIIAVVSAASALTLWVFVYLLYSLNTPFALRFLSPLPAGIFFTAQVLNMLSTPMSLYLRAHKKEPFVALSLLHAALSVALILTLGKYFAAIGIALSSLLVNIIVMPFIAVIWYRYRRIWHADEVVKGLLT